MKKAMKWTAIALAVAVLVFVGGKWVDYRVAYPEGQWEYTEEVAVYSQDGLITSVKVTVYNDSGEEILLTDSQISSIFRSLMTFDTSSIHGPQIGTEIITITSPAPPFTDYLTGNHIDWLGQ